MSMPLAVLNGPQNGNLLGHNPVQIQLGSKQCLSAVLVCGATVGPKPLRIYGVFQRLFCLLRALNVLVLTAAVSMARARVEQPLFLVPRCPFSAMSGPHVNADQGRPH